MQERHPESLKGQFLMAMPGLADPNFVQTVTCICEHTPSGAVGVVVNRVHPFLSGKEVFDELKMEYISEAASLPIYIGGPVHVGEIFVLHGPPFDWQGTMMITPSMAMSNTRDILSAIVLGNGPESFMIALGCAGWGLGQLEAEIKQNVWLTCPISDKIVFDIPVESRWNETMKMMGIDPILLSDTAGHA